MTEWKDISTAPQDGIWVKLRGGWTEEDETELEGRPYVLAKWDSRLDGWRFTSFDSEYYGEYFKPTEWSEA